MQLLEKKSYFPLCVVGYLIFQFVFVFVFVFAFQLAVMWFLNLDCFFSIGRNKAEG
jgi:hypothetical protein